ncbi:MAG: starch synthase, partial [Vibrio sp.]|nr:starch synthase [Vibrio sp.]
EVGGLKDTVRDYDKFPEEATGFGLHDPSPEALLIAMQRAMLFYLQHPETMLEVQQRAMRQNFSWQDSAKEYIKMYHLAFHD